MAKEQNQTGNAPIQPNINTPAMIAKQYTDAVEKRVSELVKEGGLHLPGDYSASNAVRSAFLNLQDVQAKDKTPALQTCTKHSIMNALLSMVVQGLNVDKKQGYFIAYGDALVFQRSYFGSMAVAKRVNPEIASDGFAYAVVYEGDELEYRIVRGKRTIVEHRQRLENIEKGKIIAAYCEVYTRDGCLIHSELMTIEEIKQAWRQSKMYPIGDKGEIKVGSTHEKFTADMALKTVINKTCKPIINASSDKALLDAIARTSEVSDESKAQADADENANGDFIDVEVEEPQPLESVDQQTGEVIDMPEPQERIPTNVMPKTSATKQQNLGNNGPGF